MHFEQTNEWARFQQAVGRRVYVFSSSKLVPFERGEECGQDEGIAVEREIFGPYRYLEVNGWTLPMEEIHQVAGVLQEAGNKAHVVFMRWTPPLGISNIKYQISNVSECGLVAPQILVHQVPPKTTLILNVSNSEEELLKEMHEKTRYNIRLAERKGVEVNQVSVQEGFEKFWRLMQDTARRDKIGIHTKGYYQKMLEIMKPPLKSSLLAKEGMGRSPSALANLFIAECGGVPLATAILITYNDTATYLHGGSSSERRNLMAPHLLQWRMIQFGKNNGCRWYDMWGISPQFSVFSNQLSGSKDPWVGITRFKRGFGGEVREGAGTFDRVGKPAVYNFLAAVRHLKQLIGR